MAQTDAISKNVIIPQQNYYSGVKIDIHNPTVNVPNNTDGYAKPDFKIYQYDNKPMNTYQIPYLPQTKPQTLPLPKPQPVKELPQSVLEHTTIKVPEPVFIETQIKPDTNIEQPNQEFITNSINTSQKNEEIQTQIIPETSIPKEVPDNTQIIKQETTPINITPTVQSEVPETKNVIKSPIEIIPPAQNASPVIDYAKVSANLNSENYDIQALQLKEIIDSIKATNKEENNPYLTEQVFLDVISIVNKDATNLADPTDAQLQIRAKIIENFIAQVNQEKAGAKDIVYPHQISEQDMNYANALAPRELAERNREYAITTLAILSKEFTNQVEAKRDMIVPITDVPGMSAIVNALKNENYTIRLSALGALSYIQKPEYTNELRPIYEALINTDNDESVRMTAKFVLDELVAKQTTTNLAA